MAYYIVRLDGHFYANEELYITAVARGERSFIKMLASKQVEVKKLFDQTLYMLDEEQQKACASYNPRLQMFDEFYSNLNILSKETIKQSKDGHCASHPDATMITINNEIVSEKFGYGKASFFSVKDFKESKKYGMLSRMAAVKVCGRIYIALNAVDVRLDRPIVATLKV